MTVIDNRRKNPITTFGDLPIGEAFLYDEEDNFFIKTDFGAAMVWDGHWCSVHYFSESDEVIPLEVTYSFTNKEVK